MRMALNPDPDSAALAVSGESVVAIARRYWRLSAFILLLVAVIAGARYLTAPRRYIASQDLTIALIPAQGLGNPGDVALATSYAQAIAHSIASSNVVTTSAFAGAVLTRVPAETVRREGITAAKVQQALSATERESRVRLQATWSSEAGARAIVLAAALALQADPQVPASALNPGDSVSAQVAPNPPEATLDPQQQENDLNVFIQQLVIGLGIALLLPWAFAGLASARARRVQAPSTAQ
jgi:hypothetical protein